MSHNLINLLSREDTRTLQREYVLRLVVLAIVALAFVVVLAGVSLIPSLMYENRQVSDYRGTLHQFSQSSTTEEKEVDDQLTTLAQQASYLSTLSTVPTASATIRAILAVPHSSITITDFTFSAPTKSNAGTLQIVGTAGTREALRAYNDALQTVPFVASADLPIGDYAQATNIPFTDMLTLSYK